MTKSVDGFLFFENYATNRTLNACSNTVFGTGSCFSFANCCFGVTEFFNFFLSGKDFATYRTLGSVGETIFGTGNVAVTAATSGHGKVVSVTVEPGVSAAPAAFLFVMKDGDDEIMLGTSKGIIRDIDDISFSPTEAIVWNATIEAASWTLIKDDGQLTS